jgi:hypothetical protein
VDCIELTSVSASLERKSKSPHDVTLKLLHSQKQPEQRRSRAAFAAWNTQTRWRWSVSYAIAACVSSRRQARTHARTHGDKVAWRHQRNLLDSNRQAVWITTKSIKARPRSDPLMLDHLEKIARLWPSVRFQHCGTPKCNFNVTCEGYRSDRDEDWFAYVHTETSNATARTERWNYVQQRTLEH